MSPIDKKRQADFQVIAQWVKEGERVLDLGCGRGVLLEYLKQTKGVYGVGVDIDFDKILNCVKRAVPAYQGDVNEILATFQDNAFDRVIFSRTVEHFDSPDATLREGLRVGKRVTVGFVNHGYWKNRVNSMLHGRRTINEVYPQPWYRSLPANPFSVVEFEEYCMSQGISIGNKVYLAGDWRNKCAWLPNLLAGYAIYDLAKVNCDS
ncbi:MAG: methionine biosynthesis protein MetW [Opitutales bacterium]